MTETELQISKLGHRGDGIAETPDGPIYVAGALPGERVRAQVAAGRAKNVSILEQSPHRIAPHCPHFGTCGGCTVQHLDEPSYLDWKTGLVTSALRDRGILHTVEPTVPSKPGSRRRAVLTAAWSGRTLVLGYHEKASKRLVDVRECPVLKPEIVALLPNLRNLAQQVTPKKGELKVVVLWTKSGPDVSLEGAEKSYDRKIPALSKSAAEMDLARLSVNGETLIEIRPPVLDMGKIPVVAPPGGFIQATEAAEEELSRLVFNGLGQAKEIADLFCGSGTFALRIARSANVHAVEGDDKALRALDKALRTPRGLKRVTMERRDLFRRPLIKHELEPYDAVVFDPPRAGAQAQAEALAASNIGTVVAVSCNPATLARDLRILIDGGYVLHTVTPVDQFLYSPHIECVAVLKRE
ncbi:23S rRNA m(5)U-1939 methyltransferase [Roseibium hamelinense]|uniref:23S rRNA m(5)U-1939 methyltransferase n=1 Tax=Roseibium hamelinense TaxID=150831 RepID=A0A562SUF2_9HYPH|nr:class I SAM-dependent RNA methyltransferase [Roseibium hamelinense]MTI42696.1 class I SAM-dependent RNA methyltransferase [Roseibium hamelinense]TWI84574.1 23S rRNA m(5)U-1939 methyltransferase [Roseibium hamelinense]